MIYNKENAIIGGHNSNRRKIYICRALLQIFLHSTGYRTSWTPGELRTDEICAISFDGKIEKLTNSQKYQRESPIGK